MHSLESFWYCARGAHFDGGQFAIRAYQWVSHLMCFSFVLWPFTWHCPVVSLVVTFLTFSFSWTWDHAYSRDTAAQIFCINCTHPGHIFFSASWLCVALLCPDKQPCFSPEMVVLISEEIVTSELRVLLRARVSLGSLGTHVAVQMNV